MLACLSPEAKRAIPQIMRLMKLLLTVPLSSAAAGRSFSMLRRIKMWTRSTMSQERLNHLTVLHEHQEVPDKLDLSKMSESFLNRNQLNDTKRPSLSKITTTSTTGRPSLS